MSERIRVLICGTGGGAHVLAGLLSAKPGVEVRLFAQSAEKVRRWRESMRGGPLTVAVRNRDGVDARLTAGRFLVTDEPVHARDCDVVILSAPAFLHRAYLNALHPYVEDGCVIVGLPGQNGFEFDVREALGWRLESCVVMNFESLPWICRVMEFGRAAIILGTKEKLVGAMQGDALRARVADPVALMQSLLGEPPALIVSNHLLAITLRSPNAYSHPPIMYGRWKDWDGEALDSPPLFYQGVDEATADLLGRLSEEVVNTSRRIMVEHPHLDLSSVIPMYEWDIGCYGNDIEDKTNLMTALRTNSGYRGIAHPMIRTACGGYAPDFNHRFLAEDIPFGLVVIRGIAEIAGVPTPCMDEVLSWCQERMGKEYLVGERLAGKDLMETRCPQRYGLHTMADVVGREWVTPVAQAI